MQVHDQVILRDSQKENVDRHLTTLNFSPFTNENSVMGAGKTHMASYIIKKMGFKRVITICPNSVTGTWINVDKTYGLGISHILTYESLAGKTGCELNHKLLVRTDDENYQISQYLIELIQEGVFVILDEFQKIKNSTTNNYKAVKAIVHYICTKPSKSRVMFLSASPFDDDKQKISFLRMVGIINHRKLYNRGKAEGSQELKDFCFRIDPEETNEVLRKHPTLAGREAETTCAILYERVICKHLSSAAPPPEINSDFSLDCKNGYYNMSASGSEKLSSAIEMLNEAVKRGLKSETNWSNITKSLVYIEIAKIEIFVNQATKLLESNPNCKVGIMVSFNGPKSIIADLLAKYQPLILDGSTKASVRNDIVTKFQQPNNDHRLLICNIIVASLGLDLHDTNGNHPRFFFASSCYRAMILHQATHRIYRDGVKSKPYMRFVFGKCGSQETSILNVLAKRKVSMKSAVPKQLIHDSEIRFPSEYENEVEPDTDQIITPFKLPDQIEIDQIEQIEEPKPKPKKPINKFRPICNLPALF